MDQPAAPADAEFLDGILDQVLQRLSRGTPVSVDELCADRPHLREQVAELVELGRRVAVQRAPVLPSIPGYTVQSELGRGGMGIVYRAKQQSLGRSVALKVLRPSLTLSDGARVRFLHEARGMARVRHPHIVAVHEVIDTGDLCAYTMELVEGQSLAGLLTTGGARPIPEAVHLTIAIARALAQVHGVGLLHRDVKPSNILLRPDGTPLLSDFGLIHDDAHSAQTLTGQFLGTPAYAAPEQLRGEKDRIGPWSDVYSLGLTLHQALGGGVPFACRTPAEMLRRLEGSSAPPLRSVRRGIPRDLDTIVAKAVDPEPARRYQTAAELADDLERFVAFEPIHARRASWFTRAVRAARRNRTLTAAVVSGLAVLLVTVVLGVWFFWVPGHVERLQKAAWRLLLDMAIADRGFVVAAEASDAPRNPLAGREQGQQALEMYARALWWRTDRLLMQQEHDVLLAARAIAATKKLRAVSDDKSQAPGETDEEWAARKARRQAARQAAEEEVVTTKAAASGVRLPGCPLTMQVIADTRSAGLSGPLTVYQGAIERATSGDRRALGLLAFLSGEFELCVKVWRGAGLDLQPIPNPLVDAALGEAYLARDQGALAFARLALAFHEFPDLEPLAVDLADAAIRAGDPDAGRRFLAEAHAGQVTGPFDPALRIHADLSSHEPRTKEQEEEVRASYEQLVRNQPTPILFVHYARFLAARGEYPRAAELLVGACRAHPNLEYVQQELAQVAELLWQRLPPKQQVHVLERANATGEFGASPLLDLAAELEQHMAEDKSAALPGPGSVPSPRQVSLRDLLITTEVLKMNRFPWPGLAPATLRALLRTALVLDSEPVSSRIPSARRFLAGSLRGLLSVTSLLAAMPGRAVAQSHLFTFAEPQGAYSCAAAGDVDHDGVPDIIVGSDCNGRGKATVYSGRWGTVIWQWFGRTANDNLGISVSGAGDVNRDGYDDVIIGASFQQSVPATAPGYAEIRSGCDGTVLRTLGATAAVGDNFGHFVRNAGDVNGDGYPDQMVGAIQLSNRGAGYVQVFSGQNGAVLRLFQGQAPGDFFGIACDAIGDVDGGGRSEFVVGAHGGSGGRGYVRVFSGETGNLLYQVTGAAVGDHLGVSVSRLGGDVTGDGLPDFAVGTNAPSSATGYALVCSGANGHQFRRLAGTTTGDHFGYQVAAGGDVDVDGIQDLLVGTDRLYRNLPGLVQVYSGQSWQAIRTFVGRGNGDRFGICVASPGDINGDQVPDLMAGSIFPANGGILEVVSGKRLESLVADRHTISRSAGGQVTFACEAGSAHAGNIVVLAGSMTGTSPCIPLSATACLPLVIDAYTSFSLSGGIFIGSPDFLDASGSARVTLSVPPNTWPLGLRVHHAYVVIGNGLASIPMASNAVPLAITQ